jgi:DNA-binding phage protein
MSKRKPITTTPLTRWLLEYVEEHETNLTELALQAGLSGGSLRSLVTYPERIPALETCLRLSKATGKPVEEIFQMAGLNGSEPAEHDPDRIELIRAYQDLSKPMQHALLAVARALEMSASINDQ